ncbi:PEP-CTERM sorting domain-containing protein [Nitrosospira lacus]|uniref:PEP-CTERM sorting domain-containing protein n=1 Tax=Nitrosospira lacus TaxID=1288494 RepID=A0A1W6SR94_9PROT|nr:PEP-CTERM sorting domain-containing protein [Nitrosospira lacus]ARO88311.1 PEP-CTERM sorting domain-containing protein [Nitrosospira lacus]
MSKLSGPTSILALVLATASSAQALPIYSTANFSGEVTNVTKFGSDLGLQKTNTCSGCPEGFVGGHLLFDANLTPGAGSGIISVPLASVAGASNDLIFDIILGGNPLEFYFGDANTQDGPAIQFKNGVFNGLDFVRDFSLNGHSFELSMQGKNWDIKTLNSNGVYSQLAASGHLNIGNAGLTHQQVFMPTPEPSAALPASVPEPATLALLGLGFLGLAAVHRRRRELVRY